ncbi:flagellar biosynthesis protein FlhA [uncultured Paludibaculum sp.]|uniref:flagellar biosynthesis protein FlhA n=1 Tax=uncultured Paludibaculum sp. TaxID=1765020 RepID=UPI002AAB334A|nr:flagellar biosynthesis protein FlhA [uncultured Paludibaculum sp.]
MTAPVVTTPASSVATALPPPGRPRQQGYRPVAAPAQEPLWGLDWRELVRAEVAVPIAVLGILMAMITPLPSFLLDVLISANITLSTVVLLVSMYIRRPADFSVFPTTLLLMTLFRLALNVSSSRLILLNGSKGTSAAGEVIESFGNFVVGGNFVIGVVIFLVLIAIQYVVINHGAVRISEVTARFTLDALPGKQMSIDADLNAGLINEAEAKARRKSLSAEAEFYGAMDGATRFTQRDAVASILITAINIVAGFLIGVLQHGMQMGQALETYTVLTIGDGLVTVIPALMISISGGLIVTRASSEQEMGADFAKQMFGAYQPLFLASGVLVAMALFPGLPKIPFLVLGGSVGYAGYRVRQKRRMVSSAAPAPAPQVAKDSLESLMKVEPLSVEVGLGLVKLVEGAENSPLLRRIAGIRRQLASELGYILPPVRVTDNLSLKVREYVVLLKGTEVARYELPQGCDLAIPPANGSAQIQGVPTKDPAFGIPAVWIGSEQAERARSSGCTVVDSISVLATHLSELVRRHCHEIFSRQDAKKVLDRLAEENPRVVEDLVPKLLPLPAVQRVFQNLLRERVSIKDANTILESLGEAAVVTRNPILLTEYVRQSLRRSLVKPHLNANGELAVFFLDPELERSIEQAVEHGENTSHLNLPPQKVGELLDAARSAVSGGQSGWALLASSGSRSFVRQMLEANHPQITVLSHGEVPPGTRVVSLGVLKGTK